MKLQRQLVALADVALTQAWRSGDQQPTRRMVSLLLRAFGLYVAVRGLLSVGDALVLPQQAASVFEGVATVPTAPDHVAAARWILWALVLMTTALRVVPNASRVDDAFLSSFPVSSHARGITALLKGSSLAVSLIVFMMAAAQNPFVGVVCGVSFYIVAACGGDVLAFSIERRAKRWVSALALVRGFLIVGATFVLLVLCSLAFARVAAAGGAPAEFQALLQLWPRDGASIDPMYHFAYILMHQSGVGVALGLIVFAGLVYAARLHALASEGVLVGDPFSSSGGVTTGAMNAFAVERVLAGRAAPWLARQAMPMAAASTLLAYRLWLGEMSNEQFQVVLAATLFVAAASTLRHARAAVQRDVLARPLLCTLPMAPSLTLRAKTAWMQTHAVSFAAGPLVLFGLRHDAGYEAGLSLIAAIVALVAFGSLAVSVAFLSEGNSEGSERSRLEQALVVVPLLGLVLPVSTFGRLVSLVALLAITFEARRAALQNVRWSDDPVTEKQTQTWRALLVFGVFFPAQLVATMWAGHSDGFGTALAYAASGALLALLSMKAAAGRVSVLPLRRDVAFAALPVGLLLGQMSHLYSTPNAQVLNLPLLLVVIVMAPIVEELYFRGVLQGAMERELPNRIAWLATLPAAFAFSAVHLGSEHLPIFVLGLCCGVMTRLSGGVLPAMIVHASYNAVVLLRQLP